MAVGVGAGVVGGALLADALIDDGELVQPDEQMDGRLISLCLLQMMAVTAVTMKTEILRADMQERSYLFRFCEPIAGDEYNGFNCPSRNRLSAACHKMSS